MPHFRGQALDFIYCNYDELFEVSLEQHKIALCTRSSAFPSIIGSWGKDIESYNLDDQQKGRRSE